MFTVQKLFTAKYSRTDGREHYAHGGYAVVNTQGQITVSAKEYQSKNGREFKWNSPNVFDLKRAAVAQAKWMNEHAND